MAEDSGRDSCAEDEADDRFLRRVFTDSACVAAGRKRVSNMARAAL